MADSSFEIDYNSSGQHYPTRRYPSTPVSSRNTSRSFTAASSSRGNHNSGVGRRNRALAIPINLDDDRSWQTEVSWQIEPTGWLEYGNRNLGSIVTPWAASPTQSDRSRVFRRSARDYYLSRTRGIYRGNRFAANSDSEASGYVIPSGRVELQSYVAEENGDQNSKSYSGFSRLDIIKEGIIGSRKGKNSPLAEEDELSFTSFSVGQEPELSYTKHDSYSGHGQIVPVHFSHGDNGHSNHHGIDKFSGFREDGDLEDMDYDDDENHDLEPPKAVGLFSLFRYSTKWDLVLLFLGCLGALIDGGSLPWYSYLFGQVVNKLSEQSRDGADKDQIMKDIVMVRILLLCSLLSLPNNSIY